jgi:hypothetical protein
MSRSISALWQEGKDGRCLPRGLVAALAMSRCRVCSGAKPRGRRGSSEPGGATGLPLRRFSSTAGSPAEQPSPLRLGAMAMGAVQLVAARVDVGPRLPLRLSDRGEASGIALDRCQRAAGAARPASGLAPTLASDVQAAAKIAAQSIPRPAKMV